MQPYTTSSRKQQAHWRQKDRKHYKNPYFKSRKPKNTRLIIGLSLLGLAVLGWVYLFYFSPFFIINQVEISGLSEIPKEDFSHTIDEYIDSKTMLVLSNRNIFIIDEDKLSKKISEKFSLEGISLTKEYPNKILIEIIEKSSAFIWSEAGQKHLVDKTGEIIKEYSDRYADLNIPQVVGPYDVKMPEYEIVETKPIEIFEKLAEKIDKEEGDDSSETTSEPDEEEANSEEEEEVKEPEPPSYSVGQGVISAKKAQFILDAHQYLKDLSMIEFDHFEMPPLKNHQLNIVFKSGLNIFLHMKNDLKHQINTLSYLLNGDLKDKLNQIEYIDLRFGERIYYK